MPSPIFAAFAALILSSAVFAQSAPEAPHGVIEVRTSKFKATYVLPADPVLNPSIAGDERYEVYNSLTREQQLKFLDRRQDYLSRMAKLLTRPAMNRLGATGLFKDKTLVEQIEDSRILKPDPEPPEEDSLVQWWQDSQILDGGGPWGVKTFPASGTRVVQKFLSTIDDLLWNDARNIATGQDSAYMAGSYIGFGPSVGKWGFYLGAGIIPTVVIDRKNQKLRFKLYLHSERKDYDPVGNMAWGMEGALQFMAGPYIDSEAPVAHKGIKKLLVEGKMWKLPTAPFVYIYSNGADQKYAGRTALIFSQATISLPMTLYAAAGGPQGALIKVLPGLKETAGAMAKMWAETLGPSTSATLATGLQVGNMVSTMQTKFLDLKVADISINYGENSVWNNFVFNPVSKAWTKVKAAIGYKKASAAEKKHFTCLDLGNL